MTQIDSYLQVSLKTRQLRLLVALADHGSLRQVSDILHVTVPAVSKALAELERGLGLALFHRSPQGLRPTDYGDCLIAHARGLLNGLDQAREDLKALRSGSAGRLHVGVLPASTSVLLPDALAELKRRSPGTALRVTEGSTAVLLPELWQGRLDMVVGRLPPASDLSGFDERELLEEPVALMTRPDHPLARQDGLRWADLTDWPWVLPPAGSLLRGPLDRALAERGVVPADIHLETLSTHLVRAYLQRAPAIGVLAGVQALDGPQPLRPLPLRLPRLLRPAGVLWNRNRRLSPSARLLIDCLERSARQLHAAAPAPGA